MKKYIYLSLISILFFVSGFYTFQFIEDMLVESLDALNLSYYSITSRLFDSLKFAVICGIIPIVFMYIWRKTNVEEFKPKLISVALFLITTIVFIEIWKFLLLFENEFMKQELVNADIKMQLSMELSIDRSVEGLQIPLYIFMAMVLGFISAFVYLKKSK